MNINIHRWLTALLFPLAWGLSAASTGTHAVTVYRCGVDGRDLRDGPCPSSTSTAPDTIHYDRPTPEQRKAAREQARHEQGLAREMQRDRSRQEALDRRLNARAGTLTSSRPSKSEAAGPTTVYDRAQSHKRHRQSATAPTTTATTTRTAKAPTPGAERAKP